MPPSNPSAARRFRGTSGIMDGPAIQPDRPRRMQSESGFRPASPRARCTSRTPRRRRGRTAPSILGAHRPVGRVKLFEARYRPACRSPRSGLYAPDASRRRIGPGPMGTSLLRTPSPGGPYSMAATAFRMQDAGAGTGRTASNSRSPSGPYMYGGGGSRRPHRARSRRHRTHPPRRHGSPR